jgi:hypothetical protein
MIKKIVKILLILILIGGVGYIGYGVLEYNKWLETKTAVAIGGYPWQCGGTISVVQAGCTRSCMGKCCCALCDALCDGSTQVIFSGQPICGLSYMCIAAQQQVKGTPIQAAAGKQFITGNTSSNLLMGNGVIATPSMAAGQMEKLFQGFDYIIAGFKDKLNF